MIYDHMLSIMLFGLNLLYVGDPIPSMLMRLLLRDKTSEMQLAAAKCLAYLYRAGAMDATDPRIVNKVWPSYML